MEPETQGKTTNPMDKQQENTEEVTKDNVGFVRMGVCIVRGETAGIAQGGEGQGWDQVYCCGRVGRAVHRYDAFHGRSRQRRNRHCADFDVFDAGDDHPCNMDNLQR